MLIGWGSIFVAGFLSSHFASSLVTVRRQGKSNCTLVTYTSSDFSPHQHSVVEFIMLSSIERILCLVMFPQEKSACLCVEMCVHACKYACVCVHLCVHVYVCIHAQELCVCMYVWVYACVCVCACMYGCMRVCVCVCMWVGG